MLSEAMNFYPSFSPEGYRALLAEAQARGYRVSGLHEAFAHETKTMVLRHDIDFSIECANDMAALEHELGVQATYFFMVSSEYYNLCCEPYRAAVHKIADMGHEIGLHWDSRFLPDDEAARPDFLQAQLTLLESMSGQAVVSASQHIPTDTPPFDIQPYVENNAYSPRFNARFTYVSDSSMQWREITPLHLMAQGKEIQFLAHPLWWMSHGTTQREKLTHALSRSHAVTQTHAEEYLVYMQKVLDDRATYDRYFLETQQKLTTGRQA